MMKISRSNVKNKKIFIISQETIILTIEIILNIQISQV